MSISLLLQGYNFNRSAESIALDMIFLSTGFRIPAAKIKFEDPVVMDIRPDIDDDPNTYVMSHVDRNFDRRIGGRTGFLYRRLPLELLAPTIPDININAPHLPFKTSDVLDQINQLLKTRLTMNDLVEFNYLAPNNQMVVLANPKSLAWVGQIVLGVNTGYVPPIVNQTDLSGFEIYNNP